MILFDPATARDVLDGLRLLEGRLIGTPRRISAGAREIRRVAERSLAVSSDHASEFHDDDEHDDTVSELVDIPAAATILSVSTSTVRRLLASGQLERRRIGRSVRISHEDITSYIERTA